jgi:hypothetical protein
MVQAVKNRSDYTYSCKICGLENFNTQMEELAPAGLSGSAGVPITVLGNYGHNATPTPTTDTVTVYTATSLSFASASGDVPAKISDSLYRFADKLIKPTWSITIETESGINDGSYTIADRGVTRGEISVDETGVMPNYLMIAGEFVIIAGEYVTIGSAADSGFTTEPANSAGKLTIKKLIYVQNITTGCAFCGSLASR